MTATSPTRRYRAALGVVSIALVAAALLPSFVVSRQRPLRLVKAWALGSELLADEGVMFQSSAADCGHVALMMVLRRFGVPVPIRLIELAGGARWGLSVAELAHESRQAGLAADVLKIDGACLEPALTRVPMPAVALLGTHFVVIEGRPQSGMVAVIDPGLGRMRMPVGVVRREWRDVLITFGEPSMEVRPAPCG